MLPFLKPKPTPSVTEIKRKPDESPEKEENSEDQGLMACASDLIEAIHSKDSKAVASAIKAIFSICESNPNEEYSEQEGDSE